MTVKLASGILCRHIENNLWPLISPSSANKVPMNIDLAPPCSYYKGEGDTIFVSFFQEYVCANHNMQRQVFWESGYKTWISDIILYPEMYYHTWAW